MDNADSSLDLRTIVPSPPDLGQAAAREQGWWREGRISPVLYWTRTIQDQRPTYGKRWLSNQMQLRISFFLIGVVSLSALGGGEA
jgi:hypothetical protein